MRLRIRSDGWLGSSSVENVETGETIDNVTKVTWTLNADGKGLSEATVTMVLVEVDVVGQTT